MAKERQDSTKRKAVAEETLLLTLVQQYFKLAALVVAIWLVGYFCFSPSWLLLGLVVYIWKEKHNRDKRIQIQAAQASAKDEQQAILARVEDMPSWVFFPDIERAEWVNKMINQVWPYIGDYVEQLLRETIQPKVQESLPASLGKFQFVNIDLGDIPPRIGGVKVYSQNVRRDEIYMDLEIIYSSDAAVEVKIKGMTAGIKDLQLRGTLRVVFKPLISIIPLFGGISVFFLNNPKIDFNLTSLANAFDLPGLNDMLGTIVQEQVANIMVLPNRICVATAQGINLQKLRYPNPHGVLRIYCIEARDLKKADVSLIGGGKSDPYAVIRLGAQKFKTKVINNTVTPKWNAVFETIIDVPEGQFLEVELRDEDPGSKDDELGNVSVELQSVAKQGMIDSWLPLEDVKQGLVHLKLVWLYLANDPLELERQMEKDKTDDLSSCILMVNMDSARDLPRSKKQMAEPSPYAVVSVGNTKYETDVKENTDDPRWEKNFRFLVHDPHVQDLDIEVLDKKSSKSLGSLSVQLNTVLTANEMTLDRYFNLTNSGAGSQVNMRLCLRVLSTEFNPEWLATDTQHNLTPTEEKAGAFGADEGTSVDKPATTATSPSSPVAEGRASPSKQTDNPSGRRVTSDTDVVIPEKDRSSTQTELRQRKSASPSSTNTESNLGRLQLTFRYSTQRQTLIVVIHKCENLIACDSNHLSDPYIKLYLLPDKSSSGKRKTQCVKDNLNPVFDETFEFNVTQGELPSRKLDLTVKNEKGLFSSSRSVMGKLTIDLQSLDISKAITEWFDLFPEDSTFVASIGESEV